MNWLIYVSGWMWGMMIFIRTEFPMELDEAEDYIPVTVTWTATWIWICWKFIH